MLYLDFVQSFSFHHVINLTYFQLLCKYSTYFLAYFVIKLNFSKAPIDLSIKKLCFVMYMLSYVFHTYIQYHSVEKDSSLM